MIRGRGELTGRLERRLKQTSDDSPLWNSASGEQLNLGRVGIPRGELQRLSLRLIRPLAEHGRQVRRRGEDRIKKDSPCGIALQANNSILVESVFHGAKGAKFGEIEKYFSLASLRSWRPFGFAQDRLGAKIFLEVVLLNILSVRI